MMLIYNVLCLSLFFAEHKITKHDCFVYILDWWITIWYPWLWGSHGLGGNSLRGLRLLWWDRRVMSYVLTTGRLPLEVKFHKLSYHPCVSRSNVSQIAAKATISCETITHLHGSYSTVAWPFQVDINTKGPLSICNVIIAFLLISDKKLRSCRKFYSHIDKNLMATLIFYIIQIDIKVFWQS